jgi:hypothetical protein
MPLERQVRLFGSTTVLVVMRSHPSFGEALAGHSLLERGVATTAENAISEMLTLYCERFIKEFMPSDTFLPYQPEPSHPGSWPNRSSDVWFSVEVFNHPVEVRIWIDMRDTADWGSGSFQTPK